MESMFDRATEVSRAVWDYQIITIDGLPLTVSRVVVGLGLIAFSVFIARRVSRFFARKVLTRFGLEHGAVAGIQSLLFYVLVALFTLFALKVANVPLGMFAVLGGALAIGVGFGSQNIVNNFISGLILLIERPIKEGDVVEVDDTYGAVEVIGARSTRIRTPSNTHIVVPNSSFLEKTVVNWTLSDNVVRTRVLVGVAYGSPTREVQDLILQVAKDHPQVLDTPQPIALFTEFGDNSLNFELNFWLHMKSVTDRRILESDIRHTIDAEFRKRDIVIAYPQRDLHLDTVRPLDVRMVGT